MSKKRSKKRKKKKTARKVVGLLILFLVLAAAGVFGGVYYVYSKNFSDRFFEGTFINGMDCSSLTVDEVEERLRADAEDYSVSITFRDGRVEVLNHDALGFRYVSDGSVQSLMDQQNPYEWVRRWFDKTITENDRYEFTIHTTYDEACIRDSLYALPPMIEANMEAPTDAKVDYADGSFQVVPEIEGNMIDQDKVLAVVLDTVSKHETAVDVESISGAYLTPSVRADDPGLIEEAAQLNSYVASSITLHMPDGDQVLDGNTLRDWLVVDENGNYSRDEAVWNEKLSAYVDGMAEAISALGETRTIAATGIGEVTVSGGDCYWELDVEAERAQLAAELAECSVTERYPNFSREGFSYENNGLGTKYVEIDLSRQHLWFYIDNELFFDTDIVSGTMSTKYWTPPGIFKIKLLKRDAILRGEKLPNGKYEYESPVSYWMPFNLDIGMHDATWRGSFGGDIYVWSGSHGCINLPLYAAEIIFNNIDYETPVVCYYSDYYELH